MIIQESGENYLEAILIIEKEKQHVRSVDISTFLGVSKPSVNKALKILVAAQYIEYPFSSKIVLTDSGRDKALSVLERHHTISEFLTGILNVDERTAEIDACRIEHILSDTTFQKIKELIIKKKG
ncbi:MAG: metal-dependent transcriptional regulator [Oscillospiraceae bacterium]